MITKKWLKKRWEEISGNKELISEDELEFIKNVTKQIKQETKARLELAEKYEDFFEAYDKYLFQEGRKQNGRKNSKSCCDQGNDTRGF